MIEQFQVLGLPSNGIQSLFLSLLAVVAPLFFLLCAPKKEEEEPKSEKPKSKEPKSEEKPAVSKPGWKIYSVQDIDPAEFFKCSVLLIPSRWQFALEFLVDLIKNHVLINRHLLAGLFATFTLLAASNLLGATPYVFTPATQLVFSLGLSSAIWLSVLFTGLCNYGINFLSSFTPAGTPLALAFLLVPIELLSFTAKAFSLGLRLCINISTGHLLQLILADFALKLSPWPFLTFAPLTILFLLSFLELGILIMQSLVFTILSAIYIADAYELH